MALTMVLADDEPFALRSEELFLRKEFPEIEIVGMAENGIQLKQMLEQYQPDMAIVDVRMPGLTGIEVIELLKHRGCRTHFIMNTAYSDFEYVKKALDLKTDGYLLKPSKKEEKLELINRLKRTVEEEKKANQRRMGMDSALGIVNSVLGSEILMSVFSKNIDQEGFDAYCKINSIRFSAGCIATFLPKTKTEISKRQLNDELERSLRGICHFLATITSRGVVVMFFVPYEIEKEQCEDWCRELTEMIAGRLAERFGVACLSGTGSIQDSFEGMADSYRDSVEQLQSGRMEGYTPGSENEDKMQGYIDRAREYIADNFRKDISLIDCAKSAGISPYYLSRIFREQTGQTFIEYLSQVRIDEARRLCVNTAMTINEIAERCGYMNISYFCKVFKRTTGKTIGEYRKIDNKETLN